jgi:hypothetical protein
MLRFVFIYIVLCPLRKQYNDTVSILHDGVIIGAGVAEPSTASSLTPDYHIIETTAAPNIKKKKYICNIY